MTVPPADQALAEAYEASFGRLVGWLYRMTGDVQLAEDAVAAAFASAVTAWRERGVPDAPEAWLRVAARNSARTAVTRRTRSVTVSPDVFDALAAREFSEPDLDDRLALLFVCAHPAIDPRLHAPLMLQLILGVDAARIAGVYLVPATTMGQRLSRAKAKIRDAGMRFRRPEPEELPARVEPILQAVYAAYGAGDTVWDVAESRDGPLRNEAIRLAEVITEVMPGEPEGWGLLALLLHTESRRDARIVHGEFVPLEDQNTALWSAPQRTRADECLRRAAALGAVGRFQLEAAISAMHSARADGIEVDADALVTVYRGLLRLAPSIGASIGAAGALLRAGYLDDAAEQLDVLPEGAVRLHQPYWVCRAELEAARGDVDASRASLDVAIGLTRDPVVRAHLVRVRLGRSVGAASGSTPDAGTG